VIERRIIAVKRMVPIMAVGAGCALLLIAQPGAQPEVFTPAQAASGRTAYMSSCVNCHGETLIPAAGAQYMGQEIPPLAGAGFMTQWGARTTSELSRRIRVAMGGFPPKDRGEKTYLDLAAYVLQVNGARAGTVELTAGTAVVIEKTTGGGK
jgi:cytochrome c